MKIWQREISEKLKKMERFTFCGNRKYNVDKLLFPLICKINATTLINQKASLVKNKLV